MKKTISLILIFLTCKFQAQLTPEQLYENVAKNSFVIYNKANSSIGTGFLMQNGWIVTNRHVVEGASPNEITISPVNKKNEILGTEKLIVSDNRDIALIKQLGVKEVEGLQLDTTKPKIGATVYVLGNSEGLSGTFSSGMISGIRESVDKDQWLQMTAPISHGNSGGPVVNVDGKVIGISTLSHRFGQNLNFAIPSAYLVDLCNKNGLDISDSEMGNKDLSLTSSNYIFWKYFLISVVALLTIVIWVKREKIFTTFKSSFTNNKYIKVIISNLLIWVPVICFIYYKEEIASSSNEAESVVKEREQRLQPLNLKLAKDILSKESSFSKKDTNLINELYVKAYPYLLKAAEENSPEAMRILGDIFSYEKGFTEDKSKAFNWYQKASDRGDSIASERCGDMVRLSEEQLQYYKRAYYQNNIKVLNSIAECFKMLADSSLGGKQYYDSSYYYLNLGISKGVYECYQSLAYMYEQGTYLKKDYKLALLNFKKSGSLAGPDIAFFSYWRVSDYFEWGYGVKANKDSSLYYLNKAKEANPELAEMFGILKPEKEKPKKYNWD